LDWLTGGSSRLCLCGIHKLTKKHAIHCLRVQISLHMSPQVDDTVWNLINRLPHTPSRSHNIQGYWQTH
ncbi:MAG: hypothetical protein EXX96DRAFT_479790, partial [Benjaminiella poitrasii]